MFIVAEQGGVFFVHDFVDDVNFDYIVVAIVPICDV